MDNRVRNQNQPADLAAAVISRITARNSHRAPCSNQNTTVYDDCEAKKQVENVLGSAQLVKADRPSIQLRNSVN
uniref:Uncharacterized protein n=1 Tax=Angiostrongylus cantonensis TaxID=6313 RepID=A0A0K0DA96_ANGCA